MVPPAKSTRQGGWAMISEAMEDGSVGNGLFREEVGHLAEFLVAAVDELLRTLLFEFVEMPLQNRIDHGCRGIVIEMGAAIPLRDDLVDDLHRLEVRSLDAQGLCGDFFLAGVAPNNGSAPFRGDHGVYRILHHEDAIGHSQRQRAAATAFAGDGRNDGYADTRHLA